MLLPTSSQSRMSISHTHGHRGAYGGPYGQMYHQGLICPSFDASMQPSHKNLFMLSGFLHFPTTSHSRMTILHTHGHRSPHTSPKTTRYTPKITAFCFVRILMLVFDPPKKISFRRTVFCSFLPHHSPGWAYCTPTAIGAPMAAPKQPEIPLRSLHFALSAS